MSVACVELRNGVLLPALGFGTFQLSETETDSLVREAVKTGYKHVDSASIYRNETGIGRALAHFRTDDKHSTAREVSQLHSVTLETFCQNFLHPHGPDSSDPSRQLFVTGKIKPKDMRSEELLVGSVESHLKSLGRTQADLILLHWPGVSGKPSSSPTHRVARLRAWTNLERLYAQGKIRSIGVSNFTARHLSELIEDVAKRRGDGDASAEIPMVNQIELHPLCQCSKELFDLCARYQIVLEAYSPLGGADGAPALLQHPDLIEIAESHQVPVAQICLRWALQLGFVVLPKSRNPDRIVANAAALTGPVLTDNEMQRIRAIDLQKHYCWDPAVVL